MLDWIVDMVSGKLTEETRVNPAPGQIDCLKADSSRLRLPLGFYTSCSATFWQLLAFRATFEQLLF